MSNALFSRNVAALGYARSNFNRGDELVKTGFLAKDNYDQRASTLGQSEASVAMDSAAVRSAEINLAYTEIRAPFSGRLGRNRAPLGTLVGGSGFTLNTLVQLDPLYVTFNPSERDLGVIQTARSARKLVAKVSLPDDASTGYSGELTFIDNGVDRATGTITARATVPNPKFTLLPGQYVRVRLHDPVRLLVREPERCADRRDDRRGPQDRETIWKKSQGLALALRLAVVWKVALKWKWLETVRAKPRWGSFQNQADSLSSRVLSLLLCHNS